MRRRPSVVGAFRRALALLATLALAACDRSSGNVVVVERASTLQPFDAVFEAVDSAALRTTAADPLGWPSGLAVWHGRYAVADDFQKNVKVFGRDGALLMTIGRDGGGPGEFRSPVGVAVLPGGKLAVADDLRGLLSVFDSSGRYVRGVPLPGIALGEPVVVPRTGGFLLPTSLRGKETWAPYGLFMTGADGVIRDTLGYVAPTTRPMEGSSVGITAAVVGDVVAWVSLTTNELRFLDLRTRRAWGARVAPGVYREPEWPERSLGPTDEGLQWLRAQMWTSGIMPVGDSLLVVRLSTGGTGTRGLNEHRYAVVDLAGRTLAVGGPTGVALRVGADDLLYGIEQDDEGDGHVRVFRLRGVAR